jgi:uncharacterized glyoxalase superfamily protein PhnB
MAPTFSVIGIVVSDMGTSLDFYRRLGIDVPDAADQPHVEAELPGGLRMAFDTEDTIRSFHPTWSPPPPGGRVGLAFACASPADVDATYRAMVDAGATSHLEPWDAFWGQRYASIADPDGNGVDLFAPLPVSE